ncbi:hypothetical protein GGI07_005100 [Coemansia sp. Benny D115]|nr:hypothetical protein GGI07_005100 [Coemansia sp. Benny D115]
MAYIPRPPPKQSQPTRACRDARWQEHRPLAHSGRHPAGHRRNNSIVRLADMGALPSSKASVAEEQSSTSTSTSSGIAGTTQPFARDSLDIPSRQTWAESPKEGQSRFSMPQGRTTGLQTPTTWNWLGLSRVKIGWSSTADSRRSSARSDMARAQAPWGPAELGVLARSSHACWERGRPADLIPVSVALRRPAKDVRAMLRLMLQEYVLHAQKAHWPPEDELLIRHWASVEFPRCAVLGQTRSTSQKPAARIGVFDRYLAALRCCSAGASTPSSESTLTASLCVAADRTPLQISRPHTRTSDTDTAATQEPPPAPQTSVVPLVTKPAASGKAKAPSHQAGQPRLQTSVHVFTAGGKHTPGQPSLKAVTAAVAEANKVNNPPLRDTAPADKGTFTRGSSSVNVMSRGSRARRRRERRTRATVTFADSGFKGSAVSLANNHSAGKDSLGPEQTSNHLLSTEGFCSKIVRVDASLDDSSNDAELSPEQSKDTHDVSRMDGDIDMCFFDVTAAHRKFIRGFVESYIERFFDSFFFRVAHPAVSTSRLCSPLDHFADGYGSIANPELCNAAEKEMLMQSPLGVGIDVEHKSLDLELCSHHFHICLLDAVEKCKIYEDDANWPSVDSYAVAVFNRAIEDTHYLVFEGYRPVTSSSASSAFHEEDLSRYITRTDDMVARANAYKRAYYMGIMASLLTTRYIQTAGRQTFLERVHLLDYRPVPTAPDFDSCLSEEELESELDKPWSDVAIRDALHSLIMETMPHASNESTMVAMQRAIEIYNKTIVDYVEGSLKRLDQAFGEADFDLMQHTNQAIFESIRQTRGAMTVDMTCALACQLAESWFDCLKRSALRALVTDHQFRPVSLTEVRRWLYEDRAPDGKSIDFVLNTRLYNYLKNMRVLMSESKWLYASATATLRIIELVTMQVQDKRLLGHVSVDSYTSAFNKTIYDSIVAAGSRKKQTVRHGEHAQVDGEQQLLAKKGAAPPGATIAIEKSKPDPDPLGYRSAAVIAPQPNRKTDQLLLLPSMQAGKLVAAAAAATHLHAHQTDQAAGALLTCADKSVIQGISAEARLQTLESEVGSIRKEIHDLVSVRRDVSEILNMLRGHHYSHIT